MKKLLFALVLFPAVSFAQTYTPYYGCFIEHYTNSCSTKSIQCSYAANYYDQNLYLFGDTVGMLCNQYTYALQQASALTKNAKTQKSLVSRLRKACGSRCSRIK